MTATSERNAVVRNIPERVRELLTYHLGIDQDDPKAKLQDELSLIDDLGCDSLDFVELIMAAEEEFGISLPDSEWEKAVTVKDAIDVISRA